MTDEVLKNRKPVAENDHEMSQRIRTFISTLSAYSSSHVFNPYKDTCLIYDEPRAPIIRRQNLERLLSAAVNSSTHSLWIGRDLGYLGGRRTGMALTDEHHLSELATRFELEHFKRSTTTRPVSERTATAIWGELSRIRETIFLWNVFPFHPHKPENPLSNRAHSRLEREVGLEFLRMLIGLLKPNFLVAVGRDADIAAAGLDLPLFATRHPSYGGQKIFSTQIRELYGSNDLNQEPEFPFFQLK